MTEKEQLLATIHELDVSLNEAIPLKRKLHMHIAFMGDMVPKQVMDTVKENVETLEIAKNARKLAQEILFVKYRTVVLAEWQEMEP